MVLQTPNYMEIAKLFIVHCSLFITYTNYCLLNELKKYFFFYGILNCL